MPRRQPRGLSHPMLEGAWKPTTLRGLSTRPRVTATVDADEGWAESHLVQASVTSQEVETWGRAGLGEGRGTGRRTWRAVRGDVQAEVSEEE